ncbi:membrane protein YczE [Tessaracoccus sp.]
MPFFPTPGDRVVARFAQLFGGLALFGASIALIVRAELGVMPWTVLEQGLTRTVGLSLGLWSVLIGACLLVVSLWLGLRPGLGTLANIVLVGVAIDATLAVLPPLENLPLRVGALVLGIGLNGVATGAYIGAGLGPGPRDGLVTSIAARTGRSLRLVRMLVEIGVIVLGVILGGQLGAGTIVFALSIGPLMHFFVPLLDLRSTST